MKIILRMRLQVEGFHRWLGAPPEYAYLNDRHRHVFHITVLKQVEHANRQIEIIDFKRQVVEWIRSEYGAPAEFGTLSCEMIAMELIEHFDLCSCSVMEDGENGAIVSP